MAFTPQPLLPTLLERFQYPSHTYHKIYLQNIIATHIPSSAIPSPFQASFSLTFIMKKRTNNGG